MYDYYLGGRHHFEADAKAAEAIAAAMPVARAAARANRDFVVRATRWLARERGVRQFLDIGSGIPTEPNLHQVAQAVHPDCKVVYCDNDPVVLQHARAMLDGAPEGRAAYVHADATDPESVLDAPELSDTIDLGRPVALSLNALLHFVDDDRQPQEIVRTLLGALPADSNLVLTHATADFLPAGHSEQADSVLGIYAESGCPLRPRTFAEISRFFEGLEFAGPGLVPPQLWHPDADPAGGAETYPVPGYAGVARKP